MDSYSTYSGIWLLLLHIKFLRSIHVLCISSLFLFIPEEYAIKWVYYSLLSIHLLIDICFLFFLDLSYYL